MQRITTAALRDAFVAAIRAIVPTAAALRDVRWAWVPSQRRLGRVALPAAARNFDLVFRDAMPTHEWVGGIGTAYAVRLAVATSYAGIEAELRDHLKAADAVDLRRALSQLRDPTLPGLVNIEPTGEQAENPDEANAYVEHTFRVSYHQATA